MKSLTPQQWHELLVKFVCDEDDRPSLAKPFKQNGYICATDAHNLLRVDAKYIANADKYPKLESPDVERIIPKSDPEFAITVDALRAAFVNCGIDYDVAYTECPYCDDGEVQWKFTDSDGDTHTKWDDCPLCGGTGSLPNGFNKRLNIGKHQFPANPILMLYSVMEALGIDKAAVAVDTYPAYRFNIADGIDVLTVPVSEDKISSPSITTSAI